jgi:hypothetical protein
MIEPHATEIGLGSRSSREIAALTARRESGPLSRRSRKVTNTLASMRLWVGHAIHVMSRICEMQVAGAGLIAIWTNSRDHCKPHVHCGDKARTWEGRIRFSFLSNIATF